MVPSSVRAPFAAGRVENQINAFVLHVVNQVGVPLNDLLDMLHGNACVFNALSRPRCREDGVSHFVEVAGECVRRGLCDAS